MIAQPSSRHSRATGKGKVLLSVPLLVSLLVFSSCSDDFELDFSDFLRAIPYSGPVIDPIPFIAVDSTTVTVSDSTATVWLSVYSPGPLNSLALDSGSISLHDNWGRDALRTFATPDTVDFSVLTDRRYRMHFRIDSLRRNSQYIGALKLKYYQAAAAAWVTMEASTAFFIPLN